MSTAVMMNGVLHDPEDARVSVFDRGFLYGDSVYEVLRTYNGVPFELDRHLQRLEASAVRIGMVVHIERGALAEEVRATHRAAGHPESYLRIIVTRGQGALGLDPALAEDPVRIVIAMPVKPPAPELYARGGRIEVVSVRRNSREAIDPQAKTGNYLNSVLALAEARKAGADEAIMLDGFGRVTEGASSNVFAVLGGLVTTPPLEVGILEGITRHTVFEVCRRQGRKVLELPLTEASLHQADEVFITSSIREILPVVRIGERTVGDGRPGPVVLALRQGFEAWVEETCRP